MEKANNNQFSANIGYGKQKECASTDIISTIVQNHFCWKTGRGGCGLMDENKHTANQRFVSKALKLFSIQR